MADGGVRYRRWHRRIGRLFTFVLGLLTGLAVGGFFVHEFVKDNSKSSTKTTSQQSSSQKQQKTNPSLVAIESRPSLNTLLPEYAQMLTETARQGVDGSPDQSTAAKVSLDRTTSDLLSTLKPRSGSPLKDDFTALNDAVVQYGSAARNNDDRTAVDQAYNKLIADLQKEYRVKDSNEFAVRANDLKTNIYDGVRAFVGNDYQTAYFKQLQVETNIHNLFALLQKKQ